jgi:hypothetical protein
VGSTGVAQHDLGHQLGGTVKPCRHGGIFPPHRHTRGIAVDRRGRGKDEKAHAARDPQSRSAPREFTVLLR